MKVDKDLQSFQDEIDTAIEQQKEAEATASVTDNIDSLNTIATTLHEDIGKLQSLVGEVKAASTIHLSDQNKTDMKQCGKDIATAVANQFNKLVEVNVKKLKNASKAVIIPTAIAIQLFIWFIFLVLFTCMVIYANVMMIHSPLIDEIAWHLLAIMFLTIAWLLFTKHMEWW